MLAELLLLSHRFNEAPIRESGKWRLPEVRELDDLLLQ